MERPVIVTTEYRGVFFGYAENTSGRTVHLKRARNILYWPVEQAGFLGLAKDGPKDGARVGPEADTELRKVTAVVEVTKEAEERFNSFVWTPGS